jgi:hypothetical protein
MEYRYKVRRSFCAIEEVPITRETGMSVWIPFGDSEIRETKDGEFHRYFKTYDEAAQYLYATAKADLIRAVEAYTDAKSLLLKLVG